MDENVAWVAALRSIFEEYEGGMCGNRDMNVQHIHGSRIVFYVSYLPFVLSWVPLS